MLGRTFDGLTPGTFEARRLGVHALACGRPDLLHAGEGLNQTRGLGTVTRTRRGQITVGDEARRVLGVNAKRATLRLMNSTHLNLNGTESSVWVFKNGRWQTPDYETVQAGRLMFSIGRKTLDGDQEIDISRQVNLDAAPPETLWVKAVGTSGTVVRYFVSETTKFGTW